MVPVPVLVPTAVPVRTVVLTRTYGHTQLTSNSTPLRSKTAIILVPLAALVHVKVPVPFAILITAFFSTAA